MAATWVLWRIGFGDVYYGRCLVLRGGAGRGRGAEEGGVQAFLVPLPGAAGVPVCFHGLVCDGVLPEVDG